jgi:hypothetical protein
MGGIEVVGGPDMAPQTPQRSGHPGGPGAPLDGTRRLGRWDSPLALLAS